MISLARICDPTLVDDTDLIRSRALREALHELGHLAGLGHCAKAGCVMGSSRLPEEVDRKGAGYCDGCHTRLGGALDPGTRAH